MPREPVFSSVAGSTLIYNFFDLSMTYYLKGNDTGECIVFGNDPSYFAGLGCDEVLY